MDPDLHIRDKVCWDAWPCTEQLKLEVMNKCNNVASVRPSSGMLKDSVRVVSGSYKSDRMSDRLRKCQTKTGQG